MLPTGFCASFASSSADISARKEAQSINKAAAANILVIDVQLMRLLTRLKERSLRPLRMSSETKKNARLESPRPQGTTSRLYRCTSWTELYRCRRIAVRRPRTKEKAVAGRPMTPASCRRRRSPPERCPEQRAIHVHVVQRLSRLELVVEIPPHREDRTPSVGIAYSARNLPCQLRLAGADIDIERHEPLVIIPERVAALNADDPVPDAFVYLLASVATRKEIGPRSPVIEYPSVGFMCNKRAPPSTSTVHAGSARAGTRRPRSRSTT